MQVKCIRCKTEFELQDQTRNQLVIGIDAKNRPTILNLCDDCDKKLERFLNGEFLYQDYDA